MIYSAISTIANAVNATISNRFSLSEEKLLVSNLVNIDGSNPITEPDKIVLTLANIQQETISSKSKSSTGNTINLNLFLLFSVCFEEDNYLEGLRYLSSIISFFQSNKTLTHANTPDMDPEIDKLTFEMVNQDLQNMSYLWGNMGGKYLPSVLYKVRMVTIRDENFGGVGTPLRGFGNNMGI
jgi:hypothetical protein